ncbi:MAG: ABC transporter permease [Clostridiales bacterium]|nr:ABC transporter permease [Clostridiales bacterium]
MSDIRRTNPFRTAVNKLLKNKLAVVCLFILLIEIIMVIFAPLIAKYDYSEQDPSIRLRPGFWAQWTEVTDKNAEGYNPRNQYVPGHYLGTDAFGRDVFSRILYGGRVSLTVGVISTLMGLVVGVACGLLAAYFPKLDNPIMRVMDLLFAFPSILLAMLIIAMLGINIINTTIAIAIWSIPSFARMVRGKALQVKEEDYIMATRSLGAKDSRILFNHILKNCLPTIIVIATMRMASSLISISTLSYLGMGVVPPQPEWGDMISAAKEQMWNRPELTFVPGIVVMVTVICFNILGDKLRDILDPSLKD